MKRVRKYLSGEDFCFTYGDGVGDVNIAELVKFHKTKTGKKSVEVALLGATEYSQYLYRKQSEGIKKAEPVMSEKISSILSEHRTEKMSWFGKSILNILDFFSG